MYCIHCGKPLSAEASFCPNCGKTRTNHFEQPLHTDSSIKQGEEKTAEQLPPEQLYAGYVCSNDASHITPKKSETKRSMSKWMLVAVFAAVAVLAAFLILVLADPADTKTTDTKPTDTIQQSSAVYTAGPSETPTAAETPRQTDVQPKEGECLYTGYGTYFDIDNLKLSFILSADKSYIYGVKIDITNLNTSITGSNTGASIKISSETESFSGQYPVDYKNGTDEIVLGASKISNLYFDGASARFELDYTYIFRSAGMESRETKVPFGITYVEMVTEDDTEFYPQKPENTETIFDESKLQNWNGKKVKKTLGVSNIRNFTPDSPVPMYYIVSTDGVIDPVTGKESEGGYNKSSSRHFPISTNDMLRISGNLMDGGLTLTDDPNKATYVLILNYSYMNNIGSFHFNEDDSTIPQYHATLDAELLNLVTGESIYSQTKNGYATYAGETVNTSMLNKAKGKQLYGGNILLYADDFEGYWGFVSNDQDN